MEKKTIFLELPTDIVDEIDRQNVMGDRSAFILDLLKRQLKEEFFSDDTPELVTRMEQLNDPLGLSAEIRLINKHGNNLGKFDINTVKGFENLAKKIHEISEDPIVKMRAKNWL